MEQEFHCGEKNANKAGEGRRSGGVLRTDQQSVLSKGGECSPGENLQPHLLQWRVWKLGRAGVESEPREAPAKMIPEKKLPGAAWKDTVASAIEIFQLEFDLRPSLNSFFLSSGKFFKQEER